MSALVPEYSGARAPRNDPMLQSFDGVNDPWRFLAAYAQFGWISQAVTISWAAGATIPAWTTVPDDRNSETSIAGNDSSFVKLNIGLLPTSPNSKTPYQIINETSPFAGQSPQGRWHTVGGVRVLYQNQPALVAAAAGTGIAFFAVYPYNATGAVLSDAQLEIDVAGDTYTADGTDVDILSSSLFSVDNASVVDNGDGTYTFGEVDNPFPSLNLASVLGPNVTVTGTYTWVAGDGVDGSWYLNTDTREVFYRTAGEWAFSHILSLPTDPPPPPTVVSTVVHHIKWGAVGSRYYETGVDRGVLYVDDTGVAWNGLISVSGGSSGGEPKAYYIDGFKYLNRSTPEEYEATIQAFSSPVEFDACDGNISDYTGLTITRQRRKSFGLCYRTKIGNDIDGNDHGYKLHLVYNALAAPSDEDYTTIGESVEPMEFSWSITAAPPLTGGYRPTAEFVIDSRTTASELLASIEDILYGTDDQAPSLPSLELLEQMYGEYEDFKVTLYGNGSYSVSGSSVEIMLEGVFAITHSTITDHGDGSFTIEDAVIFDVITPDAGSYEVEGTDVDIVSGEIFAMDNASVVDNGDGTLTIL